MSTDLEKIEISVQGRYIKWYERKGYIVPTYAVQLWTWKNGKRIKNGIDRRVKLGTKILIDPADLPPSSNQWVQYVCDVCGQPFNTRWSVYRKKMSKSCRVCAAKKGFKGGCQDYWVDALIINNPDARCDISGETDRRFLELHHLLSKKLGGKNEKLNYVILSANYHTAFHRWVGTQKATTPEQYYQFKAELRKD